LYFHVSKKEYSISATNKHCAFRKQSVSKTAERKAPKRNAVTVLDITKVSKKQE
jgi:hypothetical protein